MTVTGAYSAVAAYTPTEGRQVYTDRTFQPGNRTRLVVVLHGINGTAVDSIASPSFASLTTLFRAIAAAGMVVIATDAGGLATWGNDTVKTAVRNAITWAHSTYGTTTCSLLGISMGNASSFITLAGSGTPPTVDNLIGIVPVSNLTAMHTANRGGHTASIDAAYSGSYTTNGTSHDPLALAPSINKPLQLWYGSSDTTVLPAEVEALAAAYGGTTDLHLITGGGHGNTTFDEIDPAAVIDFLN